MWNDGLLNENAGKNRHEMLLREAEDRRRIRALRQRETDDSERKLGGYGARLWMMIARLLAARAGVSKTRRIRVSM